MIPLSNFPNNRADTGRNRFFVVNQLILYKLNDYSNCLGLLYLFSCLTSYQSQLSSPRANLNKLLQDQAPPHESKRSQQTSKQTTARATPQSLQLDEESESMVEQNNEEADLANQIAETQFRQFVFGTTTGRRRPSMNGNA